MTEVVVDTSMVFKWFSTTHEDAVDAAARLLVDHGEGRIDLIAPASLPLELANGLRYSPLLRDDVLAVVDEFRFAHIGLFELDADLLCAATALAYEHGLTVHDAVFLALAEERGCAVVTADRKAFAGVASKVEIRLL